MPEPTVYIVTVTGSAWLNLNYRCHWTTRHKLTKEWRTNAGWAARAAITSRPRGCACVPPVFDRIHVAAYALVGDNRRRDPHNLLPTAKACIDGMVDVGVIEDDSDRYLDGPDMRLRRQATPVPTLELHITPMDGGTS